MTTTPFRAAFWAMGLAFAMTALLVVPNPNKIRLALRAQRHQPLLPYERSLLAHVNQTQPLTVEENAPEANSAAPKVAAIETAAPVEKQPASKVSQPEQKTVTQTAEPAMPVKVAAAEHLTAPLGITSAPAVPEEFSAAPVPPKMEVAVAAPVPEFPATSVAKPVTEAISIPVPDPIQRTSQSAMITPAVSSSLPAEPVVVQNHNVGNPGTQDLAAYGVLVVAGVEPGKWTFRFEETPMPIVLKAIGQQCGLTVLADPSISGSFSGEFPESDPVQALGTIVKFHHYTVSRRGNYMLIGVRETFPASRTSANR